MERNRRDREGGVLAAAAALIAVTSVAGSGGTRVLNVYNWGEYISDGSDGSLDTIKAFESWYEETYGERVRVNYSTFASNEDLYAKLKSGAVSYDVIIPSDYMIARLQEEGMLLPIGEDLPKSLVVCCPKGGWQRVYLSPMSPATLQGRLAGPGGARNGTTQFLR